RSAIAGALSLPLENVTVITHGTGGGFGDLHFSEWCVVAAVLAKKAGAPVMNALSRKDNYLTATQQYPDRGHVKIGAKPDGTLVAIDAEYWTDVGAFAWPAVGDAISPLQITFNVPNAHFKGHTITTNKPKCAYWRTVGEPGGLFIMDIVLEELAAKLNMDPLQLRLKNIKKLGDTDNGSLGLNSGQQGLPFASMALDQCFQKVSSGIGWSSKYHAPGAKTLPDGRMHGIGVSGYVCNKGQWGGEVDGAIITSTTDGGFFLMIGQSSINTEASTQTYVAAEAIGCNAGDVKLGDYGNTATCQNCGAQGGSTRTVTTGHAVRQAGFDVRNQLFTYAAPMLKTTPDKLSASLGKIYLTSDPTKFVTMATVLADGGTPPIIGKGYTPYDNSKVIRTTPAAAVEIAVDTNTGAIEVLDIFTACDVGTANSKLGCEGQIEGGACQSLGHQLFWGWDYDASNGTPMNPSLLYQKPETIMDVPIPTNITPYVVESHDALGPFGAKGLGEPPYGTIGAAISNALYNATGKFVYSQPSTPWAVLKALGKSM
ncbi:MAG TPA: molybdopterin cofactor-binding domain-containing protein, partial [Conexivisphaerales archaeon]|nr:molybdopterin cofactor-binding domain-containing protein [Conexivisphaerales archaeon]